VSADDAPGLGSARDALRSDVLPILRCTGHTHRGVLTHAHKLIQDELTGNDRDMIYAETAAEIEKRRKAFLCKRRLACRAVADGLEKAGDLLARTCTAGSDPALRPGLARKDIAVEHFPKYHRRARVLLHPPATDGLGRVFDHIILHVGFEKTGTTSIQRALKQNRDALAEQDIFLPRSLGEENHKRLAAYAFGSGSTDIAVTSSGRGTTEEEVRQFRSAVARQLATEIEQSSASVAVFTTEDLSRLYHRSEIERLFELLRPMAQRISVLAFLRRQDLAAVSRYYSLVLGGSTQVSVLPPDDAPVPRYYRYAENLARWAEVAGATNVHVARFPENTSEGFDSVARFMRFVGVDPTDFPAVPNQHVSLDAVNQIILQNHNILAGGRYTGAIGRLAELLRDDNRRDLRFIPSEAQARRFYDRVRDENQAMFDDLGVSDEMFTEDFSMYPKKNMRSEFQVLAIQRLLRLLGPRIDAG
jgi:hypothetical protein